MSARAIQKPSPKTISTDRRSRKHNIILGKLETTQPKTQFPIEALKTNEINYVKEFLGHENIQTTQIYTDLKEKEVERFKEINIIIIFISLMIPKTILIPCFSFFYFIITFFPL